MGARQRFVFPAVSVIIWSVGDWSRLGQYVVDGRVRLRMFTRPPLATRAGISTRVLGDIEKGRRDNYDDVTLAALEQALEWETGSISAILAGGEPRPVRERPRSPFVVVADTAVRQIAEVLESRFSNATKLAMIEDIIAAEFRSRTSDGADSLGEVADAGHPDASAVAE